MLKDGIEGMSRFELKDIAVDIAKIMSSFALVMIGVNLIKHFIFTRQAAVYYADKVTKSYEIFSVYNIVSILIFIILCRFVWHKLKCYLPKKQRINSVKLTHDFFLVNAVTILYVIFFLFVWMFYLYYRLCLCAFSIFSYDNIRRRNHNKYTFLLLCFH